MRHARVLAVLSVVALFLFPSAPPLHAQTGTVRCESRGADREQCAIDRGARVELARHLSETPCRENANWGVGQTYIWVSGGCRAEFAVTRAGYTPNPGTGYPPANPNQLQACRAEAARRYPATPASRIAVQSESREGKMARVRWRAGNAGGLCTVEANGRVVAFATDNAGGNAGTTTRTTCESKSTDRQECRIPQGATIRLVRQLSQNPCRLNDTYGQGAGYLWVAKGCRAEFDVTVAGYGNGPGNKPGFGGKPTRVVCEAKTGVAGRTQCAAPGATSVRLLKEYSTNRCVLGRTYGASGSYIWTSGGCRGEFEVTSGGWQDGNGSGSGNYTGLPDKVTCESNGGERAECTIRTGGQVRLTRQLSSTACVRNSTWGAGYAVLWVTKGCRAEFEVR